MSEDTHTASVTIAASAGVTAPEAPAIPEDAPAADHWTFVMVEDCVPADDEYGLEDLHTISTSDGRMGYLPATLSPPEIGAWLMLGWADPDELEISGILGSDGTVLFRGKDDEGWGRLLESASDREDQEARS